MKTFQQFILEAQGDFGTKPYKPKINCYGKTVYYKRMGKRVCARGTDTGSGGASGDSGGT